MCDVGNLRERVEKHVLRNAHVVKYKRSGGCLLFFPPHLPSAYSCSPRARVNLFPTASGAEVRSGQVRMKKKRKDGLFLQLVVVVCIRNFGTDRVTLILFFPSFLMLPYCTSIVCS